LDGSSTIEMTMRATRAGRLTFAPIRSYAGGWGEPPAFGEERDRMESATG